MNVMILLLIYLALINIIAAVLTIYDKHAAKANKWRINERTLLLVSALGGSVTMLITMKIIRHKTLHRKFMLGIPAIIALQFVAIGVILWLQYL